MLSSNYSWVYSVWISTNMDIDPLWISTLVEIQHQKYILKKLHTEGMERSKNEVNI